MARYTTGSSYNDYTTHIDYTITPGSGEFATLTITEVQAVYYDVQGLSSAPVMPSLMMDGRIVSYDVTSTKVATRVSYMGLTASVWVAKWTGSWSVQAPSFPTFNIDCCYSVFGGQRDVDIHFPYGWDTPKTEYETRSDPFRVDGANQLKVFFEHYVTAEVTVSCGSWSQTKSIQSYDLQKDVLFDIPVSVLAQNRDKASVTAVCYVSGIKYGKASADWYLTPANGVNEIQNVDFAVTPLQPEEASGWPVWVQNKSRTHTEANASMEYGNLTFTVTIGLLTLVGKSLDWTVTSRAETYQCKLVVSDVWGRTVTRETSFTVLPYSAPAFAEAKALRCLTDGTENERGLSVKASAEVQYSSVGGYNTAALTIQKKESTETEWGLPEAMTIGQMKIIQNGAPDVERSYDVKFTLTDTFNTVEFYTTVLTGDYFMYFKRGGKGVAVGKAAEVDNLFDIGYGCRIFGDLTLHGGMEIHKADGTTVTMDQILEKIGL